MIAFLIIESIVAVHLLGRLAVSRAVGAEVEEIALGLGPVIGRRGRWALRASILGGRVKLAPSVGAGRRLASALGGPLACYLLAAGAGAVAVLAFGVAAVGPGAQVVEVRAASAAAAAGIQVGDVIERLDDRPVPDATGLAPMLDQGGGRPTLVELERGGRRMALPLQPAQIEGRWRAGIRVAPHEVDRRSSLGLAITEGLRLPIEYTRLAAHELAATRTVEIAGPAAIVRFARDRGGWGRLAVLTLSAYATDGAFIGILLVPFVLIRRRSRA